MWFLFDGGERKEGEKVKYGQGVISVRQTRKPTFVINDQL